MSKGVKEYTDHFGRKIIDAYDILKNETNTYYKTDTHINVKGNYFVYKYFIEKVNEIYNLNIEAKEINLSSENCILTDLKYGIGDLLWEKNLGNQIVDDKTDVFYFSNDFEYIYNNYEIDNEKKIRILDKDNLHP